MINCILWRLRTGAHWRDIRERYDPWQTCHDRFVRWQRDGTRDRLLTTVQICADAVGETVSLDSTISHAHQHAAGARRTKGGGRTQPTRRWGEAGVDLGGQSTPACDGNGRPLSIVVTPGQRHENTQLVAMLDGICVPRLAGGRPARARLT